jgi:hypothetical protein
VSVAVFTRKTMGPEVIADRDGSCHGPCKEPDGRAIRRGVHYIVKVDGVRGVFHALCAKSYCEVINEEVDLVEEEFAASEGLRRAERLLDICAELRELDAPAEAIDSLAVHAGILKGSA